MFRLVLIPYCDYCDLSGNRNDIYKLHLLMVDCGFTLLQWFLLLELKRSLQCVGKELHVKNTWIGMIPFPNDLCTLILTHRESLCMSKIGMILYFLS
jgi:hypothetical protein